MQSYETSIGVDDAIASERFFQGMLDSCSSMEVLFNAERGVVYITPFCEQLTGYCADDFYSDDELITKIIHTEHRDRIRFFLADFVNNHLKNDDVICRICTKSDEVKYVKILVSCFNGDCQEYGFRISLQEISRQVVMQEELDKKIKVLDFLAEISKIVIQPGMDDEHIRTVVEKIGEFTQLDRIGALIYEELPYQNTRIYKWDPKDFSSRSNIDLFIKDFLISKEGIDFLSESDQPYISYPVDGIEYLIHFEPIMLEGQVKGVISFSHDNLDVIESQMDLIRYTARQLQNAIQLNYVNHKLATIREKLNLALTSAAAGVWEYEVSSERMFMYDSWNQIMSPYNVPEVKSRDDWKSVLHPDDLIYADEVFQKYLQGEEELYEVDYRYKTGHGSDLWVLERGMVIERNPDGSPSRLIGININITDKKEAEVLVAKYREELERLLQIKSIRMKKNDMVHEAIVENLPAMICRWNEDTTIMYANAAYADMIGRPPEKLIGKRWIDELEGEDLKNGLKAVKYITKVQKLDSYLVQIDRNNVVRWVNWLMYPVKDDLGNIMEYQSIGLDVTEIKEAQLAMTEAKEKAEEADRLKTEFLNNISHELRTPLNAVIGFSQLLDAESNKEEIVEYADIINKSGLDLLHIIDQLMDITLIESREMNVSKNEFEIDQLFQQVFSRYSKHQSVTAGTVQLVLSPPQNKVSSRVFCDKSLVRKSLFCLLDNALKFTYQGNVEFGYYLNFRGELELFVKDTGIGIPQGLHEVIFERFRQVDGTSTRLYGGMGIGLFLVKQYMELLDGDIQLKSKPEFGSEFRLVIPLENKEGESEFLLV